MTRSSTADNEDVHLQIAEFARELYRSGQGSGAVIAELTQYAATVIPGAEYGGITVARSKRIETPAATGRYPVILDEIQQRHDEGPCLAAIREGHTFDVEDLENEQRWPAYRDDAVAATPIRSVMSFELFNRNSVMGALNVYAGRSHAFDQRSRTIGEIIATHTAFAWGSARSHEQFTDALASRDIIGQAKGMIMERYDVDARQSFDLLRRLSQDSNVGVAELARRLVHKDHPLPED